MTYLKSLIVIFALVIATVLQMTTAFGMSIGVARPDFILTTVIAIAVMTDFVTASIEGLVGGILMASVVGVNYGSFLVSRTLAGVFCGWMKQRFLRDDLLIAPVVVFVVTLLSEGVYFLMAPNHHPLRWIVGVSLEAIYNLIIAVPISAILRILGLKKRKIELFDRTTF